MKKAFLVFCVFFATSFFAQDKDPEMISLKSEMKRLDSLCDKTHTNEAYPYFWFAKLRHYSGNKKSVFHKIKVRYFYGVRYKKDVYYNDGEKIKTKSVNDKIATVRWTRKTTSGQYEKLKMVRLNDSTMVKKFLDHSENADAVYK